MEISYFQSLCHISEKFLLFDIILFFFIIHERKKITLFIQFYLLFSSLLFLFLSFVLACNQRQTTALPTNPYTVCEETYSPKSYRYHPGLWSGKKWSCCKTVNRTAFGCQAATHWTETNNNPSPSKLSLFFCSFYFGIFICAKIVERKETNVDDIT